MEGNQAEVLTDKSSQRTLEQVRLKSKRKWGQDQDNTELVQSRHKTLLEKGKQSQ